METWSLPSKVHKYIYKKEKDKALNFLSRITALNSESLFSDIDESYLRYVGYFRVQLLLEYGQYREALAWACLECELYPDNTEAIILKERIKKKIKNLPKEQEKKVIEIKFNSEWGNIAGMRELKAVLERDLLMPFNDLEACKKYKLKIPRGFLFYGPPGCGKTEIVKQLAKLLKFNFIQVDPSTIASVFVHGTQEKIKELFTEAEINKPTLLFFDEFESFAHDRNNGGLSPHYQNEVNEFLVQLNTAFERKILVIAATNFINKLDPSVIRPGRIDKKIFVGPPDFEARIEAFKLYLIGVPQQTIDWTYLGEETEFMTFAEIRYVVDEAKRKANEQYVSINLNHIMKAVKENPPTLNEDELKKYTKTKL
jgi:transitional endoplasmic reticulum ATPase